MVGENPGGYNQYAYVLNNPVLFNDPTGHDVGNPGNYGSISEEEIQEVQEIYDNFGIEVDARAEFEGAGVTITGSAEGPAGTFNIGGSVGSGLDLSETLSVTPNRGFLTLGIGASLGPGLMVGGSPTLPTEGWSDGWTIEGGSVLGGSLITGDKTWAPEIYTPGASAMKTLTIQIWGPPVAGSGIKLDWLPPFPH